MHKEKRNLIFEMALLFLFVFVFFGVIIILEKGNPLEFSRAKRKIDIYVEEKFPTLYKEFEVSILSYQRKDDSYGIEVIDKRNSDLTFRIYYRNNKVNDTYQEDYIEGSNFLIIVANRITEELEEKTKQIDLSKEFLSYRASILTPLSDLNNSDKEDLIYNKNIDDLDIYTIEASTEINNLNATTLTEKFLLLNKLTEKINFYPTNYNLSIYIEENPNIYIEIKNVKREIIEQVDIEEIFSMMLLNKDKVEKEYGIKYEIIEKETLIK